MKSETQMAIEKQLKVIREAASAISFAASSDRRDGVDKRWYIIWRSTDSRDVSDACEAVGLFYDSYDQADALLEIMNENAERRTYWRSDPPVITFGNVVDFVCCSNMAGN